MSACAVCSKPCDKKCSLCLNVFYCSKDHQKQDWKKHKGLCRPYKVEQNEELGRHLVAIRRVMPGELVLLEAPLVSGPLQVTPPLCLSCYALLSELSHIECPKCGWPMCSLACAKAPQHVPECKITTKYRQNKVKIQHFQIPHPSYECLTVLRALYLKTERPSVWEKLVKLQSHQDESKQSEKYEHDKRSIAHFIHTFFKFTESDQDEIMRISGIVNINGHEVPTGGHDFVSVYESASYLEHNCSANCSKSFTSNGDLAIRAAKVIEPGEHFSICYTDPLWGTCQRRQHLRETKFFECCCSRCSDSTELGTHFSSIACKNGSCKGYLTAKEPLLKDSDWLCISCGTFKPAEETSKLIDYITSSLATTNKNNLKACKLFIKQFEKNLHPNHCLLTDAKLAVTNLLETGQGQLSDDELELKLQYCKQLHKLTSTLVPAENRCRGVLLFGLHAALAEMGRRKSNRGEMDSAELRNNLVECKDILSQSYQLLRHEPDVLPEGQMALQAKVNLRDIECILQTLHNNMGDSVL